MCMKKYKTWEGRKMGSRLFFVLLVMALISVSRAQDTDSIETLSPPLPEDSISMKAPEYAPPHWIDYMEDGYYDTIPRMHQIPQVDIVTYTELIKRYQGEEFDYDKNSPNRIGLFKKILERLGRMLDNLFLRGSIFSLPMWYIRYWPLLHWLFSFGLFIACYFRVDAYWRKIKMMKMCLTK